MNELLPLQVINQGYHRQNRHRHAMMILGFGFVLYERLCGVDEHQPAHHYQQKPSSASRETLVRMLLA
jgi:hypothetical protein